MNAFGVVRSAFHVREHGSLWAKLRSAVNEINPRAFWRATFDNLDFRMKFAKCISSGGHLKRMLHLLTSQVTFRKGANTHVNNTSNENAALTEKHFKLEHDNYKNTIDAHFQQC